MQGWEADENYVTIMSYRGLFSTTAEHPDFTVGELLNTLDVKILSVIRSINDLEFYIILGYIILY
jgi:hypothetical protein